MTGSATTSPNTNGWYNGDVAIHWTATDALSGIDTTLTGLTDITITGEGSSIGATSGIAYDEAGNGATGSVSGLKIDRTGPSISFATPAGGAVVSSDSVNVTVNASDALSGLDSVTINGSAATDNGDGTFSRLVSLGCGANTLTAAATDKAGNSRSPTSRTITRSCMWASGVLPPMTAPTGDQGSPTVSDLQAFKIKSTIPVKFQIYLDQAMTQLMTTPPAGSVAKLTLGKYDSTTDSSDTTVIVSGAANTDDIFRWTGSPDYQYIYNLGTSGRTPGTYWVQLTLYASDGTTVLTQSVKQYFVLRS